MPRENLNNLVVSPDDFVGDFYRGQERLDVFLWHLDHYRPGMNQHDLSELRKSEFPEIDRRRASSDAELWLTRRYPKGVLAAIRMHIEGVFPGMDGYNYNPQAGSPFDYEQIEAFGVDNKYFEFLNLLTTLVYWIGENGNYQVTTAKCCAVDVRQPESLDGIICKVIEKLDSLEWTTGRPDNGRNHCRGYLKSDISRIIALLNGGNGNKQKRKTLFPRPVMAALETLRMTASGERTGAVRAEHFEMAKKILRDFIIVLMLGRHRVVDNYQAATLVSHKCRETNTAQGVVMRSIVNAADFGSLSPHLRYHPVISNGQGVTSHSQFLFLRTAKRSDLDCLHDEFAGRVDQILSSI